jgi:acetyl-CoA carboxylase biotin carboxyl carrier protein
MKNDIKTINQIIKIIGESQLTEISIEEKEFKLFIKKPKLVLEPCSIEEVEIEEISEENEGPVVNNTKDIVSETVGRFYFTGKDGLPMMTIGMTVAVGQKIGYIESIGIQNPIESSFDGKIVEILVEDGDIAEYGKVLVKIEE